MPAAGCPGSLRWRVPELDGSLFSPVSSSLRYTIDGKCRASPSPDTKESSARTSGPDQDQPTPLDRTAQKKKKKRKVERPHHTDSTSPSLSSKHRRQNSSPSPPPGHPENEPGPALHARTPATISPAVHSVRTDQSDRGRGRLALVAGP